jgi:hypothetical protein
MLRILYLLSLVLSISSLLATLAFVVNMVAKIDVYSGNAGAFGAALAMGVGGFGIITTTLFATLSGSISYLYSDKLPPKVIYSCWWSVVMIAPGLFGLVIILGAWGTHK